MPKTTVSIGEQFVRVAQIGVHHLQTPSENENGRTGTLSLCLSISTPPRVPDGRRSNALRIIQRTRFAFIFHVADDGDGLCAQKCELSSSTRHGVRLCAYNIVNSNINGRRDGLGRGLFLAVHHHTGDDDVDKSFRRRDPGRTGRGAVH